MLKNWMKIAFRQYRKNWLSVIVNLTGLCLGLTGLILSVLNWQNAESYESWNPQKKKVYFVQTFNGNDNQWGGNISYPIVYFAKEKISEIEDVLLLNFVPDSRFTTRKGRSSFETNGILASQSFFKFFPFELKAGTYHNVLSDLHAIAIAEPVSKRLFVNSRNAIGKEINIGDSTYVVKAVYALPQSNSVVKPNFVMLSDDYYNFRNDLLSGNISWGNFNFQALFKLKEDAVPEDVAAKIYQRVILGTRYKGANIPNSADERALKLYGPNKFELTRLDKTHLYAKGSFRYSKEDIRTVMTMLGLSLLVVLLSAINFINLKTAEASQRGREVGVRKVMGATRLELIVQFTMESFILCIVGFVLSLVMVELCLPMFNKLMNTSLYLYNGRAIGYAALVLFVVALVSGVIPAVYIASFQELRTLKGNFSRSRHGVLLRNTVLTVQLLISSFFIICGLITYRQVKHLMQRDLGFNGRQIMEITINDSRNVNWKGYEAFKAQLSGLPDVREVSFGEGTPSRANSSSNVDYRDITITAQHGSMDYNFLPFSGVPILAGRNISPSLSSDTINALVVNESFVRAMRWTNAAALGKEVKPGFDGKAYKIIGVCADYAMWSTGTNTPPVTFFHYKETPWKRQYMDNILVKIEGKDMPAAVQRIKAYWEKNLEPGYPFNYHFIDEHFAKSFDVYKRQEAFLFFLSVVVLSVALLGLFALSSLIIDQKLKGIAIRKVLGASNRSVVIGLLKQFLIITAIGVVVSIPVSYYFIQQWLNDFDYRISMPVYPFIISMLLLLGLTALVVGIKAYRTARANLLTYLKYE